RVVWNTAILLLAFKMVFCPFFCSPQKAFLAAFEILPYKSPPVLRRGLGWYKIKIFQKLVLFITVALIPRLFMPTRTKKEEKAPPGRCVCELAGKGIQRFRE